MYASSMAADCMHYLYDRARDFLLLLHPRVRFMPHELVEPSEYFKILILYKNFVVIIKFYYFSSSLVGITPEN